MEMNFEITAERWLKNITWEMQAQLEDGNITYSVALELCSKFLVKPDGEYYEPAEARAILGKLTMDKVSDVANLILEKYGEMESKAAPPFSEGS